MALTAERVAQILSWRGKIKHGRPATPIDETELALELDRVFARRRGGRL